MGSLKSFIKSVRAAKTLSDERNIIQKESAKIRTSFRDERTSRSKRREAVAKLLYLFTLGERTHFGQVECLKLLASPHFTDKRLGYLGTMLLLDENQEVLMLVTNSLDVDLGHPNQYVVSLGLTALANIASNTMAQDLVQRVEKLMGSSNPYLKKKAALCALRVIRRVPEYEQVFVEHAKLLLNDNNHGVLLCACSLVVDMLDNNPDLVTEFAPQLPRLISTLKLLSSTGFAPEFDVGRVPDPFLQTRLLRLLRAIGQDQPELSEQMADILAAVATNTDSAKNVGSAILYEVVLTIFGIAPQPDLRVLAVNILGKFLTNGDSNTRYTALNTLLRVASDVDAVQRHRATIVQCFRDPDVSIRRRALELAYNLINANNVVEMVAELLIVLKDCDAEFRPQLVYQIALNSERFAPSAKWHVNTLISTFELGGNYTKENVLSAFILLVIDAPDLQLYATKRLYDALRRDFSQQSLTLAALWVIGEYGDLLLTDLPASDIVDVVLGVLASPFATQVVQEYCINALVKLSTRVRSPADVDTIRRAIQHRELARDIEVQQRAIEYAFLVGQRGVLAKMPRPELGEDLEAQHAREMSKALVRRRRPAAKVELPSSQSQAADLLDLGASSDAPAPPSDLLNDIFASTQPATTNADQSKSRSGENAAKTSAGKLETDNILGLFDQPKDQLEKAQSAVQAWNSDALLLEFATLHNSSGEVELVATFTASKPVSDLAMLVAVPKSQQLTLQALSATTLSPNAKSTQHVKVTGSPGSALRLRLRISYSVNGVACQDQVDFKHGTLGA